MIAGLDSSSKDKMLVKSGTHLFTDISSDSLFLYDDLLHMIDMLKHKTFNFVRNKVLFIDEDAFAFSEQPLMVFWY